MQDDSTLYVGLDVHEDSIVVAYAIGMSDVELLGKIGTTQIAVDRLCKRLQSKARHIRLVYEAGPLRSRPVPAARRQGFQLHGLCAIADSA
jgi:hypothetical protein